MEGSPEELPRASLCLAWNQERGGQQALSRHPAGGDSSGWEGRVPYGMCLPPEWRQHPSQNAIVITHFLDSLPRPHLKYKEKPASPGPRPGLTHGRCRKVLPATVTAKGTDYVIYFNLRNLSNRFGGLHCLPGDLPPTSVPT